jgi:hypothetical protein
LKRKHDAVISSRQMELIKEWVTPRQGRPIGLCSVSINPL